MSKLYKSEVLVLRRRPLGEADEVLSLLSPDLGRFDAAVRGSRRPTSPLVGKVEPFTELSAMFARGRSLDHLTQAVVRKARPGLHGDLERLAHGAYLLELVGNILPFREGNPALYQVVASTLDGLESGGAPRRLCRWAELRLADMLGYGPELDGCAHCGRQDASWFSPGHGGLICPACRLEDESVLALSPPARAALRHLRGCRMESASRLRLDEGPGREVDRALHDHLQYHWPQTLRSREVLRRLVPS